jgi:Protein of unknown function (DUF2846)
MKTITRGVLLFALATDWMRWSDGNPPSAPQPPAATAAPTATPATTTTTTPVAPTAPTAVAAQPAPQAEPATIVVIRTSNIIGVANKYRVMLDGGQRGSLGSGRYLQFQVSAGEHGVGVSCFGGWTPTWKKDAVKFTAAAGQTYYFKIHPDLKCAAIETIDAEEGLRMLAKSKRMGAG